MEHLEDNILNNGVEGTRDSINFLRSLRDMLAGTAKSKVNVTVKWDGAPAVFAGIDPSDGKFFVAKKGIFNKNPKVYKTNADVDADTSGDLNTKLKLALAELPKLGIKGARIEGIRDGGRMSQEADNAKIGPKVRIPVLILSGGKDTVISPDMHGALVSTFPKAKQVVFPKTGHASYVECPDLFNEQIRQFAYLCKSHKLSTSKN